MTERYFNVSDNTAYVRRTKKYANDSEQQRLFVARFFEKHGIEAKEYIVSGTGGINCPFTENQVRNISLRISSTENDMAMFGRLLKIPCGRTGLRGFRANSEIMKDFANGCIAEGIAINLHMPSPRDYFTSIGSSACSSRYFEYDGKHYLTVKSERFDKNDTPDGFTEIKASEYYTRLEEMEESDDE